MIYGAIAVPLLIVDCLVLASFPGMVTRFYSWQELFPIAGGVLVYAIGHIFMRKPERLYLWAHEFTHLILAKLFFKSVHGFHITSRDGGRVVIDGTNVWIDLAPYLFPLYNLILLGAASLFIPAPPWGTTAYLAGTGFLYAMHLAFSAEGFIQGQPDLKRSGRVFSLSLVVLFLAGIVPLILAPGIGKGWTPVGDVYAFWGRSAFEAGRKLFLSGSAFHL